MVATQSSPRRFINVPNAVLFDHQLPSEARLLYMFLLSYDWQPGQLLPNIDTLMADMQCDTEALITYLYELKVRGHLDR